MAYYTHFSIVLTNVASKAEEEEIIRKIQNISGETFDGGDSEYFVYTEWYDSEMDISKVSKMFPHVFFIIEGVGEEKGDFWRRYVQNGKQQLATGELVFEDYNPSKMTEWLK